MNYALFGWYADRNPISDIQTPHPGKLFVDNDNRPRL
jgi:hypothetical protein